MTDGEKRRPTEHETNRGIDRRDVLKGITAAGVGGLALPSTAAGRTQSTPNSIKIINQVERSDYQFSVSGQVVKTDLADPQDVLQGQSVDGVLIEGGVDEYRFSGQITAFDVQGSVEVRVNGETVADPVGLPRPALPNTITIEAQGVPASYQFSVTEAVAKGPQADVDDRIDGRSVSGSVGGNGIDDFRYSGALSFESGDEPLRVVLDLNQR